MAAATDAIHVVDATGAIVRTQPLPLGASATVWPRPDATRLLVVTPSASEVGTLDADGTYHTIHGLQPGADPTYAPDGETLLASELVKDGGTTTGTLFTIRDDGTQRTVLATNTTGFDWPRFGFDGARVVYVAERPLGNALRVLDLATHATSTVLDTPTPKLFPRLTPDGSGVAFSGGTTPRRFGWSTSRHTTSARSCTKLAQATSSKPPS